MATWMKENGQVRYLLENDHQGFLDRPMEHHKLGLYWTATGYGSKIPTTRMIRWHGRLYRVYCSIWSNIGTCWIESKGKRYVIRMGY